MMSGTQPKEPIEGTAADTYTEQQPLMENRPPANASPNQFSVEHAHNDGSVAVFDLESAAEKLKCDAEPDAVSSAIRLLLDELDDRDKKIAFFETLLGYQADHLMAYKNHLLRYEDIKFYGQTRLQGKPLQKAMLEQLGYEPSLEDLEGKFIVEPVLEEHYDFAVVLPVMAKELIDRELRNLRAKGVETGKESVGTTTEDVDTVLSVKTLAEKGVLEKEKLHEVIAKDHVGQHTAVGYKPPSSQYSASDVMGSHEPLTEEDAARAAHKKAKRKRMVVINEDEEGGDNGSAKLRKVD